MAQQHQPELPPDVPAHAETLHEPRPPIDGQTLFIILTKEYCSCDDGGVVALATLTIALNTFTGLTPFHSTCKQNKQAYFDATGSEVPAVQQLRHVLEALRMATYATTEQAPRAPVTLVSRYRRR